MLCSDIFPDYLYNVSLSYSFKMEQMKFLLLLDKIPNTTEKHSEGCILFGELYRGSRGKKVNSEAETHCCFSISCSRTNSTVAFLDKKRRNFEMQIKLSLRSALFCSIDPPPAIIYYLHQNRVAKCHGYGGYIRVKKLEGWGKKSGRTHSFSKSSIVVGNSEQLI